MSRFLNATGYELTNDMACKDVVEPFQLDGDGLDQIFYLDGDDIEIDERVKLMSDIIIKNKDNIDCIIIENNELGRKLHATLDSTYKFISSVKRPNSKLHWYWTIVDRIKEVEIVATQEPKGILSKMHESLKNKNS